MSAARSGKRGVPRLQIRLLGRFEILRDGEPIPKAAWGRRKTKTLLKVLLTDPGRVFTQDQLIDALFGGESVERARDNLYGRVSQLRRALEPDLPRGADSIFITRDGQGYCFRAEPTTQVDTIEFGRGLECAYELLETVEWVRAAEAFETAIAWYRGDFLPEDRYEPWAKESAKHLRDLHLDALLALAECYAQLGRLRQAIPLCQRLLAIEPHREVAVRKLMEYQNRAGRRTEALETYREAVRVLREYLDVEPSAETKALYSAIREHHVAESETRDPRRIAVLPLASLSSDPDDAHFADGMTEELIGCLSKIRDLRVLARTSVMQYKDTRRPIPQISRELNVGSLIEGSVRSSGDEVRVAIQLIDGASGDHLWAENYSRVREGFLAAQMDVAERVAQSLQIQLLPDEKERMNSLPTQSTEAHLLYMKGWRRLLSMTNEGVEEAISLFEKAVAIDPAFAHAHAAIANALIWLSKTRVSLDSTLPRVRKAVERAFALDPLLPEAHAMEGLYHLIYLRDSVKAEAAIRKAIRLNPSYTMAHTYLRDVLCLCGRHAEELVAAQEALALSPGESPDLYCGVGRALIGLGRLEEAVSFFEEARAVSPDYPSALTNLALAKERLWRWDEAEELLQRFRELHPTSTGLGHFRHLHTRGRLEESLDLVRSLPRRVSNEVQIALLEGQALMLARRHREAIDVLARCAEAHELGLGLTGWVEINQVRATAHAEIGQYEKAIRLFKAAYNEARSFGSMDTIAIWETGMAWAQSRAGDDEAVPRLIRRLLGQFVEPGIPTLLAILYFTEGNLEEGFRWLNTAVDRHAPRPLRFIKVHPWFDPAREDPRFRAVLQRMNLAD